jgi:FG-GAP-like repeat
MRSVHRLAPLVLLALLADCASLPPIDAGVCGNDVIDPGEDCDTFPTAPGTTCRPPTAPVGACRLDCSTGGVKECPPGWGCGVDAICREPTGNFTRQTQVVAADAWRVMTGDFDGDGYSDVVARAAIDTAGYSNLRIQFYQSNPKETNAALIVAPSTTLALAPAVASPVVQYLDNDNLSDLAFIASGGLDVMLGQADQTLAPVAYPAYTDTNTSLLLGSVNVYGTAPTQALLTFIAPPNVMPEVNINLGSGQQEVIATGSKGPGDVAGSLVAASFIEGAQEACDQVVLAFSGAGTADVYSPCAFAGGKVVASMAGPIAQVKLPGAHVAYAGAAAGDVDGDGHQDLLIGSIEPTLNQSTYVAYGDGTGAFQDAMGNPDAASLLVVDWGGATTGIKLPIAVGDLNGDGKADFVCPDSIYVTTPVGSATPYVRAVTKSTGLWTDARIADMTGDGLPDVIASANDELDAAFFAGTGTTILNPFTIATAGEVAALAVADFDGDLIDDAMLAQAPADPTLPQQLTIAWGQAFLPPLPPATVGEFPVISQAVPVPQSGTTASDLAVVAHPANAATTAIVAILIGSGDRQPLAPYLLTQQGVTGAATPIAIAAGPLLGSGNIDVALLAQDVDGSFAYWLAGGTGEAQFDSPVRSASLPTGFSPYFTAVGGAPHDDALMGSGAIGPSGAQWVVGAAPLGALETSAAIVTAQATATQPPTITAGTMPQPFPVRVSPEGQLDFADVDGDGNVDVVLLSGSSTSINRSLYVAWGNGTGAFTETGALVVNQPVENPQGFSFVHADTTGLPMIAYVTRTTAVVVTLDPRPRTILARNTVDKPTSASGIATGDVDGDGVDDLVEADDENVVILRGVPVLQ